MTLRLPMPDWSRPGETWRVEQEEHLRVGRGKCASRTGAKHMPKTYCERDAVAVGRGDFALCEVHLREMGVWVEHGRVVSWRLSR